MTNIEVCVGGSNYVVALGSRLLETVGSMLSQRGCPSHCAIVTDEVISAVLGQRLQASLGAAGFNAMLIAIPSGEKSKTLEQAGRICDLMIAGGLHRQSFVIGLGGGVIGDISGFVAAIYHRGVPHVQIPTTLLAMVDSSIGGKTGVNTRAGKNLLGAVHHPMLVIDDVEALRTLPPREFNQGFAEIIKHAIIADAEMFRELKQSSGLRAKEFASEMLTPLIRRNIEIKTRIAAKDEHDRTGERALLNFGHTVGHAIERAGEYREFLHGEAISLGMVAAATVSVKKAGLSQTERDEIIGLVAQFDLPTQLPADFPRKQILAALPFDKKFEAGTIRFVVTPALGSACLSSDVTMDDIREAVEQL